MLRLVLESEGFAVTAVGSVPQALAEIAEHRFDVLVSDLNLGHPADGFVVVSAMRRTHPDTLTFILTGYPAFESALEALRQHVHDYLIKGTPVEDLIEKIKSGLASGPPTTSLPTSLRVPEVVERNKDWIVAEWLQRVGADSETRSIPLSDADRKDHVPGLLEEAINHACDRPIMEEKRQKDAEKHGTLRYHQGYTVPMLIVEARFLRDVIADCIRRNFLVIDLSNLIADMTKISDTLSLELEESVRAFEGQRGWNSARSR